MYDVVFKVDNETKQEFLSTYPTETANSIVFVLRLADDYEAEEQKSVYDMSFSELRTMISIKYKNTSLQTIVKNVSILRNYVYFCIDKNLVIHNENRFVAFTRNELKKYVSKQALEYKYISREELESYKEKLENSQDKLLLELLYVGVRGRTVKDGTLEEIINLQVTKYSEDTKNNVLKLVKNNGNVRYIQVPESTMELVLETKEDPEYVGNNGEINPNIRGGVRKSVINPIGNYVFRIPGKNKKALFTPELVNSRMQRIQEWCGNRFITVQTLYMSGMISMAKDILEEKGELTTEDYISICERYDYGDEDPERYWTVLKDIVKQYI